MLARRGRELGDPDDVWTQALWRQVQALVYSARAQHTDAERLAREAIGWASKSDSLLRKGDEYSDLAKVLEADGRREEAAAALRNALERYERKEIIPLAGRVREPLAGLERA